MNEEYITDWIDTPAGKIPKIATDLSFADKLGALGVRLLINRNNYKVEPGLYAIGTPDADSPVLVTSNYKLTFDAVRKELGEIDAWILVLDTKGINVWCAAGKGTFGTGELVNRIEKVGLEKIVNHKKIIAPQLGAVGVEAHTVKKHSGFTITYGPVRAKDIPAFMQADMKATEQMRQVRFNLYDRFVLTGADLVAWFKWLLFVMVLFFLLGGVFKKGYSFDIAFMTIKITAPRLIAVYLGGVFFGPILLPWIPGRSFALKGLVIGIVISLIFLYLGQPNNYTGNIRTALWICSLSSFLLMNFTGSSTYTSLSGVVKEMKIAVPLQLIAVIIATFLWLKIRMPQQ